ncbi:MAG: TldD/PmbA family protein [bacterium]
MLGREKARELIERAISMSEAEQTEVEVMAEESHLTRFANSCIHQNVSGTDVTISVRAVIGKKIGRATTNKMEEASIRETLKKAVEIAKVQRENPDFKSLPEAAEVREIDNYVARTAEFNAQERAKAVEPIAKGARDMNLKAFGAFTNGVSEIAIGNSLGVFAYNMATDAYVNTVVMGDTGSGYAQAASRDVEDIDIEGVATTAIEKAIKSANPVDMPEGEYAVVLEEDAVAEMTDFLGYMGFGALAYQEGRSFMCGKLGKKLVGENVTIYDDGFDKRGFAFPFDFEGVPKQKVMLIEKGVAKGLVYDTLTAGKENKHSTGHSTGSPVGGPIPFNLFMAEGEDTIERMVESTKKGIYVTRFHYTNVIEPMEAVITGMTRDGTFLIENGAITKPVKNFRFTQSVLEALSNASMVGKKAKLIGGGAGYGARFAFGTVVPPLKIEKFRFTGVTEF